jgi:anti-anti-sigma factor
VLFRSLGVLHVGTLTPRNFSDEHTDLLQFAADRAAIAIEHAQLYEQERRAREEAEHAARLIRAVQRVADAALAYLPLENLLTELLQRTSEILRSDTAAILLLEPDGKMLRARAAKGIEEEVERGVRIPLGRGFAGRIAAERRPIFIPDVDHADVLNPILREKGIRSLLGVPLLVEGRVLGVLHVGTLTPRVFSADDRDLLQLAADRAALAIDHAQVFEQRRLAEALQRSLLPGPLGDVPGLELAARYMPAGIAARLGGDWYDVFLLSGGRVGMAIGDVVGRGLPAAALMAQLRTAVRAYAFDGHDPAAVVDRVNHLLSYVSPATMTTLAYLELDPEDESVTVVSAGHPPPLIVAPDGTAAYLPVHGGVALGVSAGARYHEERFALATGSTILLYTDGVVEVRGEPLESGLEALRRIAERRLPVETLCDAIIEEAVSGDGPADDVAVLAARAEPLGNRLVTTWPAKAEALAGLRHLLRRWLRRHGAADDETYDITVACQEACANAIGARNAPRPWTAHHGRAHGRRRGAADARGHGRRPAPRPPGRSVGMTMLARVLDEWHDETPVARLEGEIDASNVAEIGDRLRSLLTNRSVSLVVDLSDTTYVDSAGINLLFALGEEMRGRQQRLVLVVPEGSPIARMISITGLDRTLGVHPTAPEALAHARDVLD